MTSRDLTGEQLDRLIREADRQLSYYLRAWRRCQANDVSIDDPLAAGVCETWNAVAQWRARLERMRQAPPQPYRPLADPRKSSGLATRTQPWAQRQRDAAAAVERHARRAGHTFDGGATCPIVPTRPTRSPRPSCPTPSACRTIRTWRWMELARRAVPDDEPDPPGGAALFPEVVTWTDEQLVAAIESADLREPGLCLHAHGVYPDRHEAFLHECSADLMRRLEGRGVAFAA